MARLFKRPRRPSVLAVAVALLALPLSGCFGEDEPVASQAVKQEPDIDPGLKDVGRNATGGLGLAETNKTTGVSHIHDYWGDKREIVLADARLTNDASPFPSGTPNPNEGVFHTYYSFPMGTIVYEGTAKLTVVVSELDPTLSGLKMRYLSAQAKEFSELIPLTPDLPVEIAVTPKMTDMPHSSKSGWYFEFFADGAVKVDYGKFRLIVTAFRGNDVEKWPGHPDFYPDGLTHRVVLEKDTENTIYGITETTLYDAGSSEWAIPEKLISMGTHRLAIWVNVTGYEGVPGIDPAGYQLEYKNASMVKVQFGPTKKPSGNSTDATHLAFDLFVHPVGHDAPYAEESRWGFRMRAIFTNVTGPTSQLQLCPGCFQYTIKYHITVIAYPFPPGDKRAEMEGM